MAMKEEIILPQTENKQQNPKDYWQSSETKREAWDRFSSWATKKEPTLMKLWFWISSHQNYKRINFYCLKQPNLCSFVMATTEGVLFTVKLLKSIPTTDL